MLYKGVALAILLFYVHLVSLLTCSLSFSLLVEEVNIVEKYTVELVELREGKEGDCLLIATNEWIQSPQIFCHCEFSSSLCLSVLADLIFFFFYFSYFR